MTSSRETFYAYVLLSELGTLYIGDIRDLRLAVHRHRTKESPGKYEPKRLVYYEKFADETSAASRAREIRGWNRKKKMELISSLNPELADLS